MGNLTPCPSVLSIVVQAPGVDGICQEEHSRQLLLLLYLEISENILFRKCFVFSTSCFSIRSAPLINCDLSSWPLSSPSLSSSRSPQLPHGLRTSATHLELVVFVHTGDSSGRSCFATDFHPRRCGEVRAWAVQRGASGSA